MKIKSRVRLVLTVRKIQNFLNFCSTVRDVAKYWRTLHVAKFLHLEILFRAVMRLLRVETLFLIHPSNLQCCGSRSVGVSGLLDPDPLLLLFYGFFMRK
jgi:hypothetical protein